MKINQVKAGSMLSLFQIVLGVVIGLLYTPVMLRLLGQSEYGLYSTVSSTISMMTIFHLGFNSGYLRYYSKYKLEKNEKAIQKLNGLYLIVFLVIGLIVLFLGFFLSFNLELVFDEGLTINEYRIAKILTIILTLNLAISFPMSVFQNIISAHERYVFLKIISMIRSVLTPVVTLPLLLIGYRSVAMVCITLLLSILVDCIYFIYCKNNLKIKFSFFNFEKSMFRDLMIFTSFIAMNMIVDQINSNVDVFLLGRFKGTVAVAIYSVGFTLYQYYSRISQAMSGIFSPRIHRIVSETNHDSDLQKNQLTSLFIKVGRIQFLVLALIATGFIFFGKAFINLWAGSEYGESYFIALLLMLSLSIDLIQNVGIEMLRAQNKHRFRSIVYVIMAVINLGLTIILCPKYGAIGAVIGTAISFLVANGLIMNIYYHKRGNIDIIAFWKSISRLSFGLIIPIIGGTLLNQFFDFLSVSALLIGIVVYTFIYCVSMWFFGMNQYERQLIIKPIKKVCKRI